MSDKEPVNVMSAVTTIINPLDPSSVLLFRCNDKSQLVIEERPVDGGDYVSITDNGCVEGNLKSEVGTTDLAAVSRGSMVCICPPERKHPSDTDAREQRSSPTASLAM